MNGLIALGSSLALFIGSLLLLHRRHNPLRRLARFRVKQAPGVEFTRLSHVTMGDLPTRSNWYRMTLSYALDGKFLYLRHSRLIPFFAAYWQIPRRGVRPFTHPFWTLRIRAAEPPIHADFGPEFLQRLVRRRV